MTLRDWLELLIVPFALVVISFVFTMQQDARQQQIESQRAQQAQKIENQRAEAERELEEQRTQAAALQAYLDKMTDLLLERNLRESEEESEVRMLAQARTLAALRGSDASHKTQMLTFLIGLSLVQGVDGKDPLIELDGADLDGVKLADPSPYLVDLTEDLSGADLRVADLREAYLLGVNLADANLRGANLSDADLSVATLSDADLREVNLSGANLSGANLSGANLGPPGVNALLAHANLEAADLSDADLRFADLSYANLHQAILSETNLKGANLSGANLKGAMLYKANLSDVEGVTKEELEQQPTSLEDVTMPDGSKHP
jgi:uncharacterized protein YjbI with pentapeptide repeats